jgi:uncharacterized protein YdeI (YjbR/CyaY-like superfamily)
MAKQQEYKQVRVDSIEAWEDWLRKNGEKEPGAWLVFRKKGAAGKIGAAGKTGAGGKNDTQGQKGAAGNVPFDYPMALDVALCYGWVDSLLKRIDEQEYMRKFTPRKPDSTWSEINKKKVASLIREGKMTEAGMKVIEVSRANGMWDKKVQAPEVDDNLPGALLHAFQDHPVARDHYFRIARSKQRQFNIWINMAKRPETISKRVEEAIRTLEKGEELGLK